CSQRSIISLERGHVLLLVWREHVGDTALRALALARSKAWEIVHTRQRDRCRDLKRRNQRARGANALVGRATRAILGWARLVILCRKIIAEGCIGPAAQCQPVSDRVRRHPFAVHSPQLL